MVVKAVSKQQQVSGVDFFSHKKKKNALFQQFEFRRRAFAVIRSILFLQARKKSKRSSARSQETYRLLRRRNLIIESVHTFRIIEGLHQSVGFKRYHLNKELGWYEALIHRRCIVSSRFIVWRNGQKYEQKM